MNRWRRGLRREVALVACLGGGLGWLAFGVFSLASYQARLGFCLVVGMAAVASWRLLAAAAPPVDPANPAPAEPEPAGGSFENITGLEHELSWSSVDAERFDQRVRPRLVRLAEDRLRRQHGIEPAAQPEAARRIVGESLWQLMTAGPSPRPPTPAQLSRLLAEIGRI